MAVLAGVLWMIHMIMIYSPPLCFTCIQVAAALIMCGELMVTRFSPLWPVSGLLSEVLWIVCRGKTRYNNYNKNYIYIQYVFKGHITGWHLCSGFPWIWTNGNISGTFFNVASEASRGGGDKWRVEMKQSQRSVGRWDKAVSYIRTWHMYVHTHIAMETRTHITAMHILLQPHHCIVEWFMSSFSALRSSNLFFRRSFMVWWTRCGSEQPR